MVKPVEAASWPTKSQVETPSLVPACHCLRIWFAIVSTRMTELAQPIASTTARSVVERAAVVEARAEIALGGRTGKWIFRRRNDQRAFANDVGERVDFERLVHHRADECGVDRILIIRIAHR